MRIRRHESTFFVACFTLRSFCRGFVQPLPSFATVCRRNAVSLNTASTEFPHVVNGDEIEEFDAWTNKRNETVSDDDLAVPFAPPLSFEKFLTMQEKRVVVTIRYTQGLKSFYLTVAKRIKEAHPDVLIEKRILPALGLGISEDLTFEVVVDGKVVLPRGRSRKHGPSVYVSMHEMDCAIAKARRKRRPTTLYGDEKAAAAKLKLLRKTGEEENDNQSSPSKKWKD